MVEENRRKIEREITNMVNDLDMTYLRKMQAQMHRCAAKCCDDTSKSMEVVQSCIERCGVPLNNSQTYIQNELQNFQNRLQRGVMQCNDEIKDKMGPSPTESDVQKYTAEFEKCASNCVDKHLELLPNMMKNMKAVLANNMKN